MVVNVLTPYDLTKFSHLYPDYILSKNVLISQRRVLKSRLKLITSSRHYKDTC